MTIKVEKLSKFVTGKSGLRTLLKYFVIRQTFAYAFHFLWK